MVGAFATFVFSSTNAFAGFEFGYNNLRGADIGKLLLEAKDRR